MGLDVNSLKDFIPFGSAMLGAVTGGLITFTLSKATQRKEKRLKGLESINELKLLVYDIAMSLNEVTLGLNKEYKKNGIINHGENIEEHSKKVQEFFTSVLVGKWANFYTKSVHINTIVYTETNKTYNELYQSYKEIVDNAEKVSEKGLEWYVQELQKSLESSDKLIENLSDFLEEKEKVLIKEYMDKYIKE